jgi:hypothetical protein
VVLVVVAMAQIEVYLHLLVVQILAVGEAVEERLELGHLLLKLAVQGLSFFATPARFNISLVAQ